MAGQRDGETLFHKSLPTTATVGVQKVQLQ